MGSTSDYSSPPASSDDEAYLYALQLTSFSVLPMTLQAASDLNLLDIIAEAGHGACLSPSEIVAKLSALASNPQAAVMVDRMLRLLAAYDVVSSTVTTGDGGRTERRYGAAPVTKYLCMNEDGLSVAAYGRLLNSQTLTKSWFYLKDAVVDGGVPFTKAHGKHIFEYTEIYPKFNTLFSDAMKSLSGIVTRKIVEVYNGFNDLNVLVDVGGCTGATLGLILANHPHVRGINFDLPHVISEAQALPGVEHIAGDMFKEVPSGDAIFMKYILHDWGDDLCVKLLKNCWKALPVNGKVIIVEGKLPITAEPTSAEKLIIHLDLVMLTQCPRGKERTEEEFKTLAMAASFSRFKTVCTCANVSVMEFYK